MAYYNYGTYNFTVDTFLSAAGTSRRQRNASTPPGKQWDHVVELQLVVAAVNKLQTTTYQQEGLHELAVFFQSDSNFQLLTAAENRVKGNAVGRLIKGQSVQGDQDWIQNVRNRWINNRGHLHQTYRHGTFVGALNGILGVN